MRVYVDSILELDVTGSFGNGRIAFYNFSQAGVDYNAFTTTCIASASRYGSGHPGTGGVPTLQASAAPLLGTRIDLEMLGVATGTELGLLALGFAPAATPTGYGGELLVVPVTTVAVIVPPAPTQTSWPFTIPQANWLCGIDIYSQFAHLDNGASHGIAFSRGLTLSLGM